MYEYYILFIITYYTVFIISALIYLLNEFEAYFMSQTTSVAGSLTR